jgi:GNAT superfamily N-acetyltransferase
MTQIVTPWYRRALSWLWRKGVRSWYRQVDFVIVCRDLELPDFRLPEGRRPPTEDDGPFMCQVLEEHLPALDAAFPAEKTRHFRRCMADPRIEFLVRVDSRQVVWVHVMHGFESIPDVVYGFQLPMKKGRDVYVFDGLVHPEHRGWMVGLLAANCYHGLRRDQGYRRAYATLRIADVRSRRLHWRLSYAEVGTVRHFRVGPFKFNKVRFQPGMHPTADPEGPIPGVGAKPSI